MVIAAGAVALFPSLAGAHHNTVTGVSACADESGTYTVTWSIQNSEANTAETATLTYTGGGTLSSSTVDIGKGGTVQVTQSGIPGTATSASLTADGLWTNGQTNQSSGSVTLGGTCTTTATPAAPTVTQAECTGPGQAATPTYRIPATTGVEYRINSQAVAAGTYSLAQGSSVTVTAVAQPGYTLTGQTSWTLTANRIDCTVTSTPATPTIAQAECTAPGQATTARYTIPTTAGVEYRIGGDRVAAGSYDLAQGSSVTVTAVAQPGYTLTGQSTWTLTANRIDCTVKATPATPTITQAACTGTPGDATIPTYTIPATAGVNYLVNGSVVAAGTYSTTQGATVSITAEPKSGYVLEGTASWSLQATAIDCTEHVTVVAAVFGNETCVNRASVDGTLVLPATTGVVYSVSPASAIIAAVPAPDAVTAIDGSNVAPGTYAITPGVTITVTARPATGYTLEGTTTFTHVYPAALDCTEHVEPAQATTATYTIPATTGVEYRVNGSETAAQAGTYPLAQGASVEIEASAKTGYTLEGDDEWTLTAKTIDCTVTTTPTAPTYTVQACLYPSYTVQPATVTIPATTGVVYSLDGVVTPAGRVTVGTGAHTVTAAGVEGYELIGYPAGGWSTTITAVPCEYAVLANPPSLASTGADAFDLLIAGGLVLLVGAGLVVATRSRRDSAV